MAVITSKSLVTLDFGNDIVVPLTEHNRQETPVNTEEIASATRMVNGRLRKYHVADKRTWTLTWEMLPVFDADTVDGKTGSSTLENLYRTYKGEFILSVQHVDPTLDFSVPVIFRSFNKTHPLKGRGSKDFWNVDLTLEEV